jgi:hypothetical protein
LMCSPLLLLNPSWVPVFRRRRLPPRC